VEVFGSFATGLYLPTSDIDMVILNSNCVDARAALRKLAGKISQQNMAKNMLVLSKARVPIVKFDDAETNLKFDISFDIDGGPETANFIKDMIRKLPQMKPLVMILKIFLQQRELNEVYSGGVGSYALIIMVSVLLMTHESRLPKSKKVEGCLGVLLIDFFDLYGHVLNMYEVGISCRNGGFFYNKRDVGFYSHERPYLLSIEDPRDTTSDIGKNSFNIQKLRSAFQFALTHLKAPETEFGELILMRIIRMDTLLIKRLDQYHQRMKKRRAQPQPSQSLPQQGGHSGIKKPAPMSEHQKMDIMGVVSISSESSEEEGEISVEMSGEDGEFSDGEIPVNKKLKKF
jgi:non-canonical poly(A) RNA polymerase PAPD5/7